MMTKEELKPVMMAWLNGQRIQFAGCLGSWKDWDGDGIPSFHVDIQWRIKPEKKLRPWRPEEVPVGALIRGKHIGVRVILGYGMACEGVGPYVLYVGSFGKISGDGLETCLSFREHSTDGGLTWKSCGILEE